MILMPFLFGYKGTKGYIYIMKNIRKEKKMTQLELAKKVGISREMISQIERGKKSPSLKTFVKIAKVLNVELSELL